MKAGLNLIEAGLNLMKIWKSFMNAEYKTKTKTT